MFGFPPGSDVEVGFRVSDSLRLDWSVGVVGDQFLERRENIFADQRALLHPTVRPFRHAHVDEALVVGALQNFQAVTVLDGCNFVVDGRHTVAEESLRRGNVGDLVRLATVVLAGGEGERESKRCCQFREKSQHGVDGFPSCNHTCGIKKNL